MVDGQFADLFKGRIYALGYPDEPECGFSTAGKEPSENITFSIPLGQCGVQMTTANDVSPATAYLILFPVQNLINKLHFFCLGGRGERHDP